MTTEIVDLDDSGSEAPEDAPAESLNFLYPSAATDHVRLTVTDLDTLDLRQYVNDNIINFYLRFLTYRRDFSDRVHVFSSFFYSTLVGPMTLNYDRVQSWTKKIDLFAKECLLVPIIQNMHWRLAVIAFPGLVFCSDPQSPRRPYIIVFDSYSEGYDPAVGWAMLQYLKLEWESRHGPLDTADLNLPELPVTHPMQDNESDCGLFVLEFAERYLQDREAFHDAAAAGAAVDRMEWFDCREAEKKRFFVKWLVRLLADGRALEEVGDQREVYFIAPKAMVTTRRRKRPRIPLGEFFQYY